MIVHSINKVEIVQVIRVSLTAGTGVDETEALRPAFQYWSMEGELVAEVDEFAFKTAQGKQE